MPHSCRLPADSACPHEAQGMPGTQNTWRALEGSSLMMAGKQAPQLRSGSELSLLREESSVLHGSMPQEWVWPVILVRTQSFKYLHMSDSSHCWAPYTPCQQRRTHDLHLLSAVHAAWRPNTEKM